MSTSYASEYPNVQVDPAIKEFFKNFYAISDDPNGHEEYANQFTADATFIVASKKAVGREQIIQMRHAMWEKVASRQHNPIKVFPFGPDANEVMLYGDVKYGLKAGGTNAVEWGARANLVKEEGTIKMSHYQVYLDTGAQAK